MKRIILFVSALLLLSIWTFAATNSTHSSDVQRFKEKIMKQNKVPVYGFKVIKTYPHDIKNYTEGLVYDDGILYESTGLYGHSKLVKSRLMNGKKVKVVKLAHKYFGEGMTVFNQHIYQLTYKSNTGFIYNKHTLKTLKTFKYPSQGWGLTHSDKYLITSDGSSALQFIDPKNFKVTKVIFVTANNRRIGFINELEYIKDKIFANIWQTDLIAIISPKNGNIIGWLDLTGLNPNPNKLKNPYVLNGIAWDAKNHALLVTGKCWPNIYEIRLVVKAHQIPKKSSVEI